MPMITEIGDFFAKGCGRCDRFDTAECSALIWAQGLADLRRICRAAGLVETVKWGHPCYVHAGRNIALIGAFRGDFRLSFFKAALLKDPEGVLEFAGPNTAHPGVIRFHDAAQVAAMAPLLRAYLAEAVAYAEAGILPPQEARVMDLPVEMLDALDGDPDLAEAFHSLTPGRQRSYQIGLASAKTAATRVARIGKWRPHILAGKGATER